MKAGFKVINDTIKYDAKFIVVCNFETSNTIEHIRYYNLCYAEKIGRQDVGRWQPKGTKELQNE